MKALKTKENILIFEAYEIKFGKLDEYVPGNIQLYAIDNEFEVVEFDPATKPEDYVEGKYFYIDGEFVLNPDWVPPLPPIEDQVKGLAEDIATVDENSAQIAANLDYIAMELGIDLDE